jgi:hypothetical protein
MLPNLLRDAHVHVVLHKALEGDPCQVRLARGGLFRRTRSYQR